MLVKKLNSQKVFFLNTNVKKHANFIEFRGKKLVLFIDFSNKSSMFDIYVGKIKIKNKTKLTLKIIKAIKNRRWKIK